MVMSHGTRTYVRPKPYHRIHSLIFVKRSGFIAEMIGYSPDDGSNSSSGAIKSISSKPYHGMVWETDMILEFDFSKAHFRLWRITLYRTHQEWSAKLSKMGWWISSPWLVAPHWLPRRLLQRRTYTTSSQRSDFHVGTSTLKARWGPGPCSETR